MPSRKCGGVILARTASPGPLASTLTIKFFDSGRSLRRAMALSMAATPLPYGRRPRAPRAALNQGEYAFTASCGRICPGEDATMREPMKMGAVCSAAKSRVESQNPREADGRQQFSPVRR